MNIKPIKTRRDYDRALIRFDEIFDARSGSKEGDELEILSILIDKYEERHFPIKAPHPVEAIKFRMEQLNLNQNDLVKIIGFKSRVSEILNKKRKLNLEMIRSLNKHLDIPVEILVKDYRIAS